MRTSTLLFCGFFLAGYAVAFTIAERGGSGYTVALPENPNEAQSFAADELRSFTKRMTGVEMKVAPSPGEATVVLLSPDPANGLGQDAFRLRVRGKRLEIEAGSDSGLIYGVYELLEKYGGCRWYASWCEKVPELRKFEVPDTLDDTQTPAFKLRDPYWGDLLKSNLDFACRLRCNARLTPKHGGIPYRFGGDLWACHTFNKLLPPEKYFNEHPEYYSEVNGKRLGKRTQLCLTNPDVLRLVTEEVLRRIREDPNASFYGVSQNDWYNYCTCEKCKAIDDYEESHAGTMIAFVNKIAEAVEKEFPNAIIETLAYQYTRTPPKHIKPRPNVMPCLCTIELDFQYPIPENRYPQNVKFIKDIEGWGKICRQVYVWDYVTDFHNYTMPFPNVLALQGNVKFFRDNRVSHLFEQGAYEGYHADFAELKAWLLAKWMWNPDLPMEPLLQDFFAGYYGKAAPIVREYFDALHQLRTDPEKVHLGCFASIRNEIITDEFLDRAEELWQRAQKAVADEPQVIRNNVRWGMFPVIYAKQQRAVPKREVFVTRNPDKFTKEEQRYCDYAKWLVEVNRETEDKIFVREYWKYNNEHWESIKKCAVDVKPQKAADSAVVEEKMFSNAKLGTWCKFVDDAEADDGKALMLLPNHYEWCTSFGMRKVAYDPDATYRLSARVRVDKADNAPDGEAFWAGVYDYKAKRGISELYVNIKDISDGKYVWYEIAKNWKPNDDSSFWIGPGRFDTKTQKQSPRHRGVFIDAIKIERVD